MAAVRHIGFEGIGGATKTGSGSRNGWEEASRGRSWRGPGGMRNEREGRRDNARKGWEDTVRS